MASMKKIKNNGLQIKADILQPQKYFLESFSRDLGLRITNHNGAAIHNLSEYLLQNKLHRCKLHVCWNWGISCIPIEMEVTLDLKVNKIIFFIPYRQAVLADTLDSVTVSNIAFNFIQRYHHIMRFIAMRLHNDETFIYKTEGIWEYRRSIYTLYGKSLAECRAKYASVAAL